MTLASTTNRVSYTGGDSTATYAYTFKIFTDSELLVTVKSTATPPVETTLTLTTDYTVTDAGETAGGNIVLIDTGAWNGTGAFLETNWILVIRRVVSLAQSTDIRNQGSFFPETHENQFDKFAMMAQQQQDVLDRASKNPETVPVSTFDPTLPTDIATASVSVVTNAAGDGFEVGPTTAEISSAGGSATAAAASASAASTSETNAAASASAASTSETNAATSETNAATSETNAGTSESNASTSASTATTQASNASTSASNASTSETNAGTSETNASASASAASTSETNAATSETNAATSETNAATSETNAATSETNAATSATDSANSTFINQLQNLGLNTSVASSALTIDLVQADGATDPSTGTSAVKVGYRNVTITNGGFTTVSTTAAVSLVVPSGGTLGHKSGQEHIIWVYAINNAGATELAVSSVQFEEDEVVTTTAIGTGSDDIGIMYSTTQRTSVPCRLIGRLLSTQSTAGTWDAAITDEMVGPRGVLPKEIIYCQAGGSTGTLTSGAFYFYGLPTIPEDTHNSATAGSGHSVTTNDTGFKYVICKPGVWKFMWLYQSTGGTAWTANEYLQVKVTKGGSTLNESGPKSHSQIAQAAAYTAGDQVTTYSNCAKADRIECQVFQNSGSSQTYQGNFLSIEYIGPIR